MLSSTMKRIPITSFARRGNGVTGTTFQQPRNNNKTATIMIQQQRSMVSVSAPLRRWNFNTRRTSSNATEPPHQTPKDMPRWKQYMHNGTPELLIGGTLLVWFLADWFVIQPYQEQEQERLYQQVFSNWTTSTKEKQEEESIQTTRLEWQSWSQKPLYRAKIVRLLPNFDGPLTLHHVAGSNISSSIQVGNEVEVLQEEVGPAGSYTLCRTITDAVVVDGKAVTVVGWYPTHALQKV